MNTSKNNVGILKNNPVVIGLFQNLPAQQHVRALIGDKERVIEQIDATSERFSSTENFEAYVKYSVNEGKSVIVLGDAIGMNRNELETLAAKNPTLAFGYLTQNAQGKPVSHWYNTMGEKHLEICTQQEIEAFKAGRPLVTA